MMQLWAIFKREIRSYFGSPIAYAVLAVYLVVSGFAFDAFVNQFLQAELFIAQRAQLGAPTPPLSVNDYIVRGYFNFVVAFIPIFLTPVLTMRLFAEERKQGTMELLMTAPVTDFQIVLGKYFAALGLYVVMLLVSFLHMGFLYVWSTPDTGPILVGYLGLFLVGATYVGIGIFISSLTENQIVAAVGTIAVSMLLFMIGSSSELLGERVGGVLEYISVTTHLPDFEKGVVDTKDVLYFLSFAGFAVFLTLRSVESMRWRG
jgi:ABC-2 type transport system permease protein